MIKSKKKEKSWQYYFLFAFRHHILPSDTKLRLELIKMIILDKKFLYWNALKLTLKSIVTVFINPREYFD